MGIESTHGMYSVLVGSHFYCFYFICSYDHSYFMFNAVVIIYSKNLKILCLQICNWWQSKCCPISFSGALAHNQTDIYNSK